MNVVVVSFITFILLLSVCFELGHEHLKETTPEAFSANSDIAVLGADATRIYWSPNVHYFQGGVLAHNFHTNIW